MEPTIRGERTVLRPLVPDDEDLLLGWLTDPGVYEHWGGAPLDRAAVKAQFTENRDPGWAGFIVEADGRPVGFLQYWHTDDRPEADTGGIDMVLLPAERGQGFGPDAARAMVGYLIGERGWRRVTVDPSLDNAAGIRAWARAGFVPDHEAPDHPDGPSLIMAIDARDWR
jgi:aminoglycoside 6'-N-acetyltransferase